MRQLPSLLLFIVFALAALPAAQGQTSAEEQLAEANRLDSRAVELNNQGKPGEALPLSRQVLAIREKYLGAEHLETATAANNVGFLLKKQGDLAAARPYLEQAVRIRKKALGPEHLATALSMQNLGSLLQELGDYAAARGNLEQALAVFRKTRGDQHADTAVAFSHFATLLQAQGDYAGAKTHFEWALAIDRKVYGEWHRETAAALGNLGILLQFQADYATARPYLEQALQINRKLYGDEHLNTAAALNNLAGLLGHQGDYAGARDCYERALAIKRKLQGEHQDTALALHNLGWLLNSQGEYAVAFKYYEEALKLYKKTLGEEHPKLAITLNGLGYSLKEREDYAGASPYYEEALRILRQAVGDQHPDTAVCLNNLAELRREQGKLAEARDLYEQALRVKRSILGESHPETAGTLKQIAIMEALSGNWEASFKFEDQSRRAVRQHVTRVLPSLSDREQLTYLQANDERELHRALSFGLTRAKDPILASLSASWLINGKGAAQEAVATRTLLSRDSTDPALAATVAQLTAVRRELAMLTLTTPKAGQEQSHRAGLDRLAAEEGRLSRELASVAGSATNSAWVETKELRQALPPESVYIDFARFKVYHVLEKERGQRWKDAHYAAWIIPPAGRGDVQIVDLGLAEAIDQAVEKARDAVTLAARAEGAIQKEGEMAAEKEARAVLQRVSDLVWKPLAGKLGAAQRLILSPDGALWLLPWGALPVAPDKCLLEEFPLQYVVSGRNVVQPSNAQTKTAPPIIFADPDFDLTPEAKRQAIRAVFPKDPVDRRELTRGLETTTSLPRVARLANTALEAQLAAPSLAKLAGVEPQSFVASYALESAAKRVQRPKLLLFATHGFFLSDQELKEDAAQLPAVAGSRAVPLVAADGKQIENPLLRCGLLLTGCNSHEAAGGDDGILTGMEIVGIDLRGTELVVLSACETGIGKVNNGEGVAGLRQAFQLAGAQAVVSTLWQVPDRDSALIMNDFFANLAEGQTKADALRNAQLKRIAARREKYDAAHPFFWAAWTVTGN